MITKLTQAGIAYKKNTNRYFKFSCGHRGRQVVKYSQPEPYDSAKKDREVYFGMLCIACREKVAAKANKTKKRKRMEKVKKALNLHA